MRWIGPLAFRGAGRVSDGAMVPQHGSGREPETAPPGDTGQGVNRKLPHLGDMGRA